MTTLDPINYAEFDLFAKIHKGANLFLRHRSCGVEEALLSSADVGEVLHWCDNHECVTVTGEVGLGNPSHPLSQDNQVEER